METGITSNASKYIGNELFEPYWPEGELCYFKIMFKDKIHDTSLRTQMMGWSEIKAECRHLNDLYRQLQNKYQNPKR